MLPGVGGLCLGWVPVGAGSPVVLAAEGVVLLCQRGALPGMLWQSFESCPQGRALADELVVVKDGKIGLGVWRRHLWVSPVCRGFGVPAQFPIGAVPGGVRRGVGQLWGSGAVGGRDGTSYSGAEPQLVSCWRKYRELLWS